MSSDSANPAGVDRPLESIRFVGPSTAAVLNSEGYDATAITDKRVSYRMLVEAGVNPGVAAKIRREHSLSWSFRSGGDLGRRSAQIRGLGSAEAAWVAASAGDWESTSEASTDATGTAIETEESTGWSSYETDVRLSSDRTRAEAAWRARSKPTPVSELNGIDTEAAELLAEAGILSVRQLASINVAQVVDVLELSESDVRTWYDTARAATN